MAKKPILVEIKEGNYKGLERWSYAIDKPGKGSKETKLQRYASASNARRAAASELNAHYDPALKQWRTFNREVVFTVTNKKK